MIPTLMYLLDVLAGEPMTPAAFERHAGRGSSKKWKDSIWVMLGDEKLQFSKVKSLDALYRHYK
eukprot:c26258_g2_i1 orf=1-189(-)